MEYKCQCGNTISPDMAFCSKCGAHINWQGLNNNFQPQPQQQYMHPISNQQFYQNAPAVRYGTGIRCPNCLSLNVEFMENKIVGRTVKHTTTINMNPLKIFTLFNHKEKVTNQGREVYHWHCLDCGKVFERDPKEKKPKTLVDAVCNALIIVIIMLILLLFSAIFSH